jgi:ribonuclease T1
MRRFTRLTGALLALLLVFSVFSGCGGAVPDVPSSTAAPAADAVSLGESDKSSPAALDEDGEYTSAEDVALYLHLHAHLPQNFITKKDARALGWNGGGLDDYADGKCIGGDRFGNYEGLLPDTPGREYHECDIDTLHAASRGAKRIVYSNDGLIYYTEDHYESFILLYGEE